jgi:methylated-DNA-[protein]-cysteine S-methyltransferase
VSLRLLLERLDTPIGQMLLVLDDEGRLRAIDWEDYEARMQRLLRIHYGADPARQLQHQLQLQPKTGSSAGRAIRDYFDGDLDAITHLPTATNGTPFQRSVWEALRGIPAGQTLTYHALALQIGRPTATRAVGLANGANPIGVVVPCHRVIGANGALTGYGGGLHRKRWLLAHEGVSESRPARSGPSESLFTKLPGFAD